MSEKTIDRFGGAEIRTEREFLATGGTLVELWLKKIERQRKEEKDWMEEAREAERLYEGEGDETLFNIWHSNVRTLLPALYNSTPIPDVRRRYGDADDVAKQVVDITERLLTYTADQYDINGEFEAVVLDALIVGRGVLRVRYAADTSDSMILAQRVWAERVPWDKYIRGPGRSRADQRWEAFEHDLTWDEIKRLDQPDPDPAKADMGITEQGVGLQVEVAEEEGKPGKVDDKGIVETAKVFEIWDRDTRSVYFICESYTDRPLRVEPDPLGLHGFFCTPKPLQGARRPSSMTPICPYVIIEELVEELDRITRRIRKLINSLRVRGLAMGVSQEALERLAMLDDMEIAPAGDMDTPLAAGAQLGNMIAWMPLEPQVKVLEQLYVQREQVKQTIFEVSGIADAMRGNVDSSKKLGQTQIETQWGSLGVQAMQRAVADMARDLFRMQAELFANHYEPQIIAAATGLPRPSQDEEQAMQAQQLFAQGVQLMKSDLRGFRIDIETDSTIRADMTKSQEQMNLFLQATGQFVQGALTLGQQMPLAIVPLIEVYTAFARKFQLGKQAEDALDNLQKQAPQAVQMIMQAMQAQQQPQEDPKVKADIELKQLDAQNRREAHQMDMEGKRMDLQTKAAETQLRMRERMMPQPVGATNGR